MKYYKLGADVYAFESDGSQDDYITDGHIEMTKEEVDQHLNPEKYLSDEDKVNLKRQRMRSLTRYQFKRCLLENGFKSSDIEAKILTIKDEMLRELTLLGFQESDRFVRTDDSVLAMQDILELTPERIDELWEYGLKL